MFKAEHTGFSGISAALNTETEPHVQKQSWDQFHPVSQLTVAGQLGQDRGSQTFTLTGVWPSLLLQTPGSLQ